MISFLIEDNENIRNFFETDGEPPVSEYMYLHTRPLLRPSFITQIDDLVNKVGHKIIKNKLSGKPVERLADIAIQLGQQMDGEMTEDKARIVVFTLRELYVHCNLLDKKLK